MNNVKYPYIEVDLKNGSGNAIAIVGAVSKALKNSDVPKEEIEEFRKDALSENYDHLLQVCMKWVSVNGKEVSNLGKKTSQPSGGNSGDAKPIGKPNPPKK